MTRLKRILLAGTIMPALALGPLTPAWAQSPDDQGPSRAHRQPRAEGAQRPEGGGPREGGPHGDRAGAADHRQGGEHKMGQGEGRPNGAGGPNHAADQEPGGRQHPRGAADTAAPAERAAPKRAAQPDMTQPKRAEQPERMSPKRAGAPDVAPKRAEQPDRSAPRRAADDNGATPNRADRKAATDRNGPAGADTDHTQRHERAGDADRPGTDHAGADRQGMDRKDRTRDKDNARQDGARPDDHAKDNAKRDDRMDDRDRHDNADRDNRMPNRDNARDARPNDRDAARRDDGPRGGIGAGFLPPVAGARRLDDVRAARRETREGDRVFIREPGRTIVQEQGRSFIVHDENDRFRALGLNVQRERRGADFVETVRRPNGDVILTTTDASGRMLRRVRRGPDGRDVVLIDNGVGGNRVFANLVVDVPPPPMRIPRDRYIVDYGAATAGLVYETLIAPPLAPPPRRYTLDQIRYSPDLRGYVRQVDVNTINFDTASWVVPQEAAGKLEVLAAGLKKAIDRNPNSVFLIEGYTDATGNPDDNLSLSDRRAQSVAEILTKDFDVPPENLTTQGYGQQNLRENTQGPSAVNRRVVVQNITPLLAAGGGQP